MKDILDEFDGIDEDVLAKMMYIDEDGDVATPEDEVTIEGMRLVAYFGLTERTFNHPSLQAVQMKITQAGCDGGAFGSAH